MELPEGWSSRHSIPDKNEEPLKAAAPARRGRRSPVTAGLNCRPGAVRDAGRGPAASRAMSRAESDGGWISTWRARPRPIVGIGRGLGPRPLALYLQLAALAHRAATGRSASLPACGPIGGTPTAAYRRAARRSCGRMGRHGWWTMAATVGRAGVALADQSGGECSTCCPSGHWWRIWSVPASEPLMLDWGTPGARARPYAGRPHPWPCGRGPRRRARRDRPGAGAARLLPWRPARLRRSRSAPARPCRSGAAGHALGLPRRPGAAAARRHAACRWPRPSPASAMPRSTCCRRSSPRWTRWAWSASTSASASLTLPTRAPGGSSLSRTG